MNKVELLKEDDIDSLLKVYYPLVKKENIYGLNDNHDLTLEKLKYLFEEQLKEVIKCNLSYCIKNAKGNILGFTLAVNYMNMDIEKVGHVFSFSGKNFDYFSIIDELLTGSSRPIIYNLALGVAVSYRKHGYGSMLVQNLLDSFKNTYSLATDSDNPEVIHIYTKFGFTPVKISRKRNLLVFNK